MYIYIYTEWTYHGFTIDAESGSADAAFRDFLLTDSHGFRNQRTSTAGVTRKLRYLWILSFTLDLAASLPFFRL